MERKAKVYGWEVQLQRDAQGFTFKVSSDPERQQLRKDVFGLMDQVSQNAREAGVSLAELFLHSARTKVNRLTGRR